MSLFLKCGLSFIIGMLALETLAQSVVNTVLTEEITSIHGKSAIDAFWNQLHQDDQANRGPDSDSAKDLLHFKKMMLMIQFHGYPENEVEGTKSSDSTVRKNFIPNLVFVHQPSFQVREYFFPVLLQAYQAGKADEFWFLHTLRSLTLGRYNRTFYEKTPENIAANLALMSNHLAQNGGFDLDVVDSLYAAEMNWRIAIVTSEKIISCRIKPNNFRERIVRDQYVNLYRYQDRLFLQQVFLDGSFNAPQEVIFDQENNTFSFVYHDDLLSCEAELQRLLSKRKQADLRQAVAQYSR